MYIDKTSCGYYDRHGQQHSSKGNFFIIMQSKERSLGPDNFRGIIRKAALTQFGHWMMGKVRIGKNWYTVSGAYGHDGLPLTVEECDFLLGIPIPKDLYDKWNKGGGWNSSGSETPDMVAFAKTLLKERRIK